MLTSRRLWEWLQGELGRLRRRGCGELVVLLVRAERLHTMEAMQPYLAELERLHRACGECDEVVLGWLARYLLGRTRAFALDRPAEALDDLAALTAELTTSPLRGGALHEALQVELLRAYHKIDAPGYREPILRGVRTLWPAFEGDAGPREELFDVWCRTGWWCRDGDEMRRALEHATDPGDGPRMTWPYWKARHLHLEGRFAEARELLDSYLRELHAGRGGHFLWELYVEVQFAEEEAAEGLHEGALARLATVARVGARSQDPMLWWDVHRVRAQVSRWLGDGPGERAEWVRALEILDGLGLDRLSAEFALALGESAREAGDAAGLARARAVLDGLWPHLRSRGELEPRRAGLGEG